ncbi:MAG: anthranilate synthase component I [bacterium]
MKRLTYSEFTALQGQGNVIPVYASYLADLSTPVSAFLQLQAHSDQAFLLESVEGSEKIARFSFLGCDPYCTIEFSGNQIIENRLGQVSTLEGNIFDYLNDLFSKYRTARTSKLPRFTGGAVGYFGYETVRLLENIPPASDQEAGLPQALFMLFDTILAFDHFTHEVYIIKNVFLNEKSASPKRQYEEALEKIELVKAKLEEPIEPAHDSLAKPADLSSNFEYGDFCRAVQAAKDYITAGDIFQVVLSQRFQKEISLDPFHIYRALRVINPSPYLYYVKFGDNSIIGSSPELLLRVEEGVAEVRPIAGTRRRGRDEAEDQQLVQELRSDEKEIAEHVMLVDLGRNDVGRVCQYGSVEVTEFMEIEKFSHVMHLVSNVRGKLRHGVSAIDALKACFPAGTVSGAPKIRAMEIISELEPEPRGVYAGALGYLDFSGNLDTCIVIRTIVTQGKLAFFQAGAGIVADSNPDREFNETLEKASALKAAIEFAEGGLE